MQAEKIKYKVAIVGSGPSGFYAAEMLLESELNIEVSMIERLPVPFGLVRYGVAPDHPKLKQPIAIFEAIAGSPRFHLFANVNLGSDVQIDELVRLYDGIIVACGADVDCKLGIPGEDLPGSHAATDFVGWYNAHPNYRCRLFDLSQESVAIIGNGNVALDVARILLKTPDELCHTEIAHHAFEALAESRVKEVHIIGRRGPAQAKFTPQELQELGRLADCQSCVNPSDLDLNAASQLEVVDKMSRAIARNMQILSNFAGTCQNARHRRCVFHFLQSPIAITGADRVRGLQLARNSLQGELFEQVPIATGDHKELAVGLVFRAVGYRGAAIPGLPFDARRGVLPTQDGRVTNKDGTPLPSLYATGWIKRGANGIIGTNRADSINVVNRLLKDLPSLSNDNKTGMEGLAAHLQARQHRFVNYAGWRQIDRAEIENGRTKGKPREKFVSVEEMLLAASY